MAHRNKERGNELERELVNRAKEDGHEAIRAYASNGIAIGESEEVDCRVADCRVQAKRRKTLPAYLQVPEGADVVVFKQDRRPMLCLMTYEDLLRLLHTSGGFHKPKE